MKTHPIYSHPTKQEAIRALQSEIEIIWKMPWRSTRQLIKRLQEVQNLPEHKYNLLHLEYKKENWEHIIYKPIQNIYEYKGVQYSTYIQAQEHKCRTENKENKLTKKKIQVIKEWVGIQKELAELQQEQAKCSEQTDTNVGKSKILKFIKNLLDLFK